MLKQANPDEFKELVLCTTLKTSVKCEIISKYKVKFKNSSISINPCRQQVGADKIISD